MTKLPILFLHDTWLLEPCVLVWEPILGSNTMNGLVTRYINPDDGADSVSKTLDCNSIITWLITQEDFIAFECHKSFKSYIIFKWFALVQSFWESNFKIVFDKNIYKIIFVKILMSHAAVYSYKLYMTTLIELWLHHQFYICANDTVLIMLVSLHCFLRMVDNHIGYLSIVRL